LHPHIFGAVGYPLLFLVLMVESLGIPSPSEFSLVYAGVLASQGHLSLPLVVLTGAFGSTVGANLAYWIALRGGRLLILKYGGSIGLNEDRLARAEAFFARSGPLAIVVGRVISGVRALISYPAGLFEMPYGQFLAYTAIGALIWPILAAGAGYLVGPHWHVLLYWLSRIWLLIVAAFAVVLAIWLASRRRGQGPQA